MYALGEVCAAPMGMVVINGEEILAILVLNKKKRKLLLHHYRNDHPKKPFTNYRCKLCLTKA